MKNDNLLENQKGVALVIALIMLLVLTLIGISGISTTTFESNIAGNARLYNLAFYIADGGLESFRGMVSNGFDLSSGDYKDKNKEYIIKYQILGIRNEGGVDFRVVNTRSEGSEGKVVIESVIEVPMVLPRTYE